MLTTSSNSGFLRSTRCTAMTSRLYSPLPLCDVPASVEAADGGRGILPPPPFAPVPSAEEDERAVDVELGSCIMMRAFWQTRSEGSISTREAKFGTASRI